MNWRIFILLGVLITWLIPPDPGYANPPEQSWSRLLRRVHLTLRGTHPSMEQYRDILDAPNDEAREVILNDTIEAALNSEDFYKSMVEFGFDYLGHGDPWGTTTVHTGSYHWTSGFAIQLVPCPEGTTHEGRLGVFASGYPQWGDPIEMCDNSNGPCGENGFCDTGFYCDAGICVGRTCSTSDNCGPGFLCEDTTCVAMTHTVEPWWAPGTTVDTIGWAGAGYTEVPHESDPTNLMRDCGVATIQVSRGNLRKDNFDPTLTPRCSCGPNLVYCDRGGTLPWSPGYEGYRADPQGQRRSAFEEPARLFAHIIVQDRPFSHLVGVPLGNEPAGYTVMNQGLQHMYIRWARQSGFFQHLDTDPWWQAITDPSAWREVVVQDVYPFLLAERNTTFDPRTDAGEPAGIPSAGVLTTFGTLASFARERPRAARWLERLTCRAFVPPPPDTEFSVYNRDPATEGSCQTCHHVIDPAAIHFKRFQNCSSFCLDKYALMPVGLSPYRWDDLVWPEVSYTSPPRWHTQFIPNTVMTPVTEDEILFNSDARFIDFAPAGTTLLGVAGDGTIGPLGFAKMIVASGEFDRCTVQRFYERFGGTRLHMGKHKLFIDKMVDVFVSNGRQIKPLIRWILSQPAFRMGR
ncbi:MAG: hypothetical protein CMH54_05565 [Myxococcales bacterium]|nr:hypothetical protein [Myxococcales bacterium]